jgi:hypothetical protein
MARRVQDWRRRSRKVLIAVSSSANKENTSENVALAWVGMTVRTTLKLDPGRSSAVLLDNPIHKEFFPGYERISLLHSRHQRLASSTEIIEDTATASFLKI